MTTQRNHLVVSQEIFCEITKIYEENKKLYETETLKISKQNFTEQLLKIGLEALKKNENRDEKKSLRIVEELAKNQTELLKNQEILKQFVQEILNTAKENNDKLYCKNEVAMSEEEESTDDLSEYPFPAVTRIQYPEREKFHDRKDRGRVLKKYYEECKKFLRVNEYIDVVDQFNRGYIELGLPDRIEYLHLKEVREGKYSPEEMRRLGGK